MTDVTADPGRSGGEGTEQTGWHRHKGFTMVHRDDQCSFSEKRPVLILDPVTARDTIARVVRGHRYMAVNAGSKTGCRGCTWTSTFSAQSEKARRDHEAHVATELLAALASQERGE